MLTVEASTPFVLTLQSVPPFFVESILALALVVLLAVPLIAHIQLLLDNNSKSSTMGVTNRRKLDSQDRRDHPTRTVVMHYPVPYKLHKISNSDLNVELTSMRTTFSTPTIKRSLENLKSKISNEDLVGNHEEIEQHKQNVQKMIMTKQKTCLPLERSSPFVATNAQLPIIDISAFDYDAYRHKLIETSLKRQYGDRQAPGNVVLNSIHLNTIGSQTGIELSERYSHSLFDFIEEHYDVTKSLSKKEKEYLHPLDHFLVKGMTRPSTAERSTETKESITELDQVPELIDFREQSPIPGNVSPCSLEKRRVLEESTKNPSKLTIRSRRSSSLPRTYSRTSTAAAKTNLVTSGRKSSTNPMTQQLFNRAENLISNGNRLSNVAVASTYKTPDRRAVDTTISRTSRSRTPRTVDSKVPQTPGAQEALRKRASSTVQGKSSTESLTPGKTKPSEYSEAQSTDRDEKESATCASASSSEAGSSCSSRPRDKRTPVRSRASSLSSKNRTIGKTPSQTKQWYIGGNANASFNRNYLEVQRDSTVRITKPKLNVRPRSTGGRFDWEVPDVPGHHSCNEKIVDPDNKKSVVSTVAERPRTVNTMYNRRRTPEKGKLSDTVLPVLESVIDLRVEMPWNDPNMYGSDNDPETWSENPEKAPSPRRHELKRTVRPRDNKMCSASFVKSSAIERPPEVEGIVNKPLTDKRLNQRDHSAESESKVLEKSSSGIKPATNRPGSASRLPVHVGTDRMTIKKVLEDPKQTEWAECRANVLDKSPGHAEKKSASRFCMKKRPRTAGCVQSLAPSLSPKIELSVEALQSNNAATGATRVEAKVEPENPVEKPSQKRVFGHDPSKIPSKPSSLASKKNPPAFQTSIKTIAKPSSPLPEIDADTSKKNVNQNNSGKKSFLRARSGKYGAPKLNAIEQTQRTLDLNASLSKETMESNEELEKMELLKLPTEGSKAALVMRRELKTYIKKIKLVLANRDKTLQTKDLVSLSITEAIIPELRDHLNPREIQELERLLHRVEEQQGNHCEVDLNTPTRLQ